MLPPSLDGGGLSRLPFLIFSVIFSFGAKMLRYYLRHGKEKHLRQRGNLPRILYGENVSPLDNTWFFPRSRIGRNGKSEGGELAVGAFLFRLEQKCTFLFPARSDAEEAAFINVCLYWFYFIKIYKRYINLTRKIWHACCLFTPICMQRMMSV